MILATGILSIKCQGQSPPPLQKCKGQAPEPTSSISITHIRLVSSHMPFSYYTQMLLATEAQYRLNDPPHTTTS